MPPATVGILLFLVLLLGAGVYMFSRLVGPEESEAEALIDRIRETAYGYSEIDSPLSAQIRKMISEYKGKK